MPIIKSAKKKLRQDKKKRKVNARAKAQYKKEVKKTKRVGHTGSSKSAYSKIDKAVKRGVLHKRKAARLKSQVAKRKRS